MKLKKVLLPIIILIFFGALGYAFRSPIENLWLRFRVTYWPCASPITYTIGSFDTKFGMSRDTFLRAVREAEQIWEKPIGKQLFTYATDGALKINLIYDYRQAATAKLSALGIAVSDDQASYDKVKAKYEALVKDYNRQKTLYNSELATFQSHYNAYTAEIKQWNAKGGAPRDVYNRLNQEKISLEAEQQQLNVTQDNVNTIADNVNALAVVLNRLATTLNISVAKYNEIGQSRGSEFEEGNYQTGPDGQQIDIYQFDNYAKLVKVLEHELGHALGLDHLENPKAIMYRLNSGINDKITTDDVAALKKQCKIK